MLAEALWALEIATYLLAAGSLVIWIGLLRSRVWKRLPLIEPRDRQAPFWTLAEFFLGFGLWLVCTTAAVVTVQKYFGPEDIAAVVKAGGSPLPTSTEGMIALSLGTLIANGLVVLCMAQRMGLYGRESLDSYGFWPRWSDLRLGLIAAVALLPPVVLLASWLASLVEYEHVVFEAIQKQPSASVFAAMFLGTAIIAPIQEEFLFRGLLQGGAERMQRLRALRMSRGRSELLSAPGFETTAESETILGTEIAAWSWWPVFLSSGVFAVMHMGQGLAPIALFVMSLGLGYLYRQTGRLWPCIVVHALLNGFSLIGFGLQTAAGS